MGSLFERGHALPRAERAHGCWITDTAGNQYLDAASGALVVNIGHDDSRVTAAITRQMASVSYVHPTAFTSEIGERYAAALAALLPMDSPAIYPVSGGSEAVETALKAARAFHVANGEPERWMVIGRDLSYHGNTRGALDVSGRHSLRAPYLPWLDMAGHVPGVLEYRCPSPRHPSGCARWHAEALESEIRRLGPDQVAAFVAEPIGGAASGAALPPDGYWEAVAQVCASHGVLLIVDEVMTGFGRTGRWFGSEHFPLRPDLMTMAKGASSGYWPLGICAMSARVASTLADGGFVHGLTFSHHLVGAAAGMAVIQRLDELRLVAAAEAKGYRLLAALHDALDHQPVVGDIRGIGLMLAVELVADRETRRPFPRTERIAERLTGMAKEEGLLVYPSTGCAGNGDGDLIMIGPPLIINDEEMDMLVLMLANAIGRL